MRQVTTKGVQKPLHLDTIYHNFPTWEENIEFEVDGIHVKAVAVHSWRREWLYISDPFYLQVDVCYPPLMALGVAMLGRKKSLAAQGITEREDCFRRAVDAYQTHLTSRRAKPIIEVDIEKLSNEVANENLIHAEKAQLLKKLKANKIDHKEYLMRMNLIKAKSKYKQN